MCQVDLLDYLDGVYKLDQLNQLDWQVLLERLNCLEETRGSDRLKNP